jgi:transmembrane sensor
MEDYGNYTLEDFVLDPEFRAWVQRPTAEAETFWQEWQLDHPEKRGLIREAASIVRNFPSGYAQGPSAAELQKMIDGIEAGINALDVARRDHKKGLIVAMKVDDKLRVPVKRHVGIRLHAWGIAASVLLIAGVAFYWVSRTMPETATSGVKPMGLLSEQNPNGKRSVVVLKDGSRVTLNADSKVSYPTTFAANKREVYLEGEAFFEVAKDAARPFEVITGGIKTVAVGTSFNVRSYPEDAHIKVSLATGKVKIEHSKTQEVLETLIPGEQITYGKTSGSVSKNEVRPDDISAWKSGILRFDHAHADEVFKALERWYGVRFDIQNTSTQLLDVNGSFENEAIEDVLESLHYSMKFNFKKEEDFVTIKYDR